MQNEFQLRDVFNPGLVERLAQHIAQVWPDFDHTAFSRTIIDQLAPLSFGDRNRLIRNTLRAFLPEDVTAAIEILLAAQGPELTIDEVTGFEGFIVWPQSDFVATYGLEQRELGLHALYEMTKRFTAEMAIRPFLQAYPAETLARMAEWALDPNCHVRRLVSEGTRPRLPLAPRLPAFIKDPEPVLALLELLKADPVLMVRRSVANNLNDIAKDHPDRVVATLERWNAEATPDTQWLIRHAARTLLKQGHPGALALFGYPAAPKLDVAAFALDQAQVRLGEDLQLSIDIMSHSEQPQALMIDYVVHHMKANGELKPKVFKLATKKLRPGERLQIAKRHPVRQISTRTYYPGRHAVELQINGQRYGWQEFELLL